MDAKNVKGVSKELMDKLSKASSKEEVNDLLKSENLTVEQLKEMSGGSNPCDCGGGYCFGESCKWLPW